MSNCHRFKTEPKRCSTVTRVYACYPNRLASAERGVAVRTKNTQPSGSGSSGIWPININSPNYASNVPGRPKAADPAPRLPITQGRGMSDVSTSSTVSGECNSRWLFIRQWATWETNTVSCLHVFRSVSDIQTRFLLLLIS